ncbi:hypothetical protein Nepgr_009368 [Nepenthes gracilis]|uniref:Uncharacterized protein n=1 Tax=Nepenthes gracilis TaxID=150966 RepID=A0AAD3XK34_NEPGR|nr:hypothetical protein Nepgr_009368 [Nepenthes gracilis]
MLPTAQMHPKTNQATKSGSINQCLSQYSKFSQSIQISSGSAADCTTTPRIQERQSCTAAPVTHTLRHNAHRKNALRQLQSAIMRTAIAHPQRHSGRLHYGKFHTGIFHSADCTSRL